MRDVPMPEGRRRHDDEVSFVQLVAVTLGQGEEVFDIKVSDWWQIEACHHKHSLTLLVMRPDVTSHLVA
ncbi:hypothetical protein GCM10010436_94090 [Paractinoplanes durhamensis]